MTVDVADTIFSKFGVSQASRMNKEKLKDYYIALVKKNHPDVGGSNEKMKYINAAYDVLKTSDPSLRLPPASGIWPTHKTYPKGKNKAKLQKVRVEFRFMEDETFIASGKSDYFDLIEIHRVLNNNFGIIVRFKPISPYDDVNEKWITDKVLIYVYDGGTRYKDYTINAVRKNIRQYY
jgi:hypothetical protein